SRGCPEFCTYCPHRILAGYRARSIANIADEMERLCDQYRRPYVIFRDPLFTEQRERCLELCDEIRTRGLELTFEAETRLDRLDTELLDTLYDAGFPKRTNATSSTIAAGAGSSPRLFTCSGSFRTTGARSPPRLTTRSMWD